MGDTYLEVLVKRKTGIGPLLGRNILIGFGALVLVLGVFTPLLIIFLLVSILLFLLAWLCHRQTYVEYEYLYLDKTLTIDKICNRSSRKKVAEYSLENMELLAPAASHRFDSYVNRGGIKTVDFSSRQEDSCCYGLLIREGSALTRALIECNDELYDQIRMAGPSKVFRD